MSNFVYPFNKSSLSFIVVFFFFLLSFNSYFYSNLYYIHPSTSFVCVLSCFSHVQLFATFWIIDLQAPLSMGFSRQEQWSCAFLQRIFPTCGSCIAGGLFTAEPQGSPLLTVGLVYFFSHFEVWKLGYLKSFFFP